MKIEKFNIRVYGILQNEINEVLVCDEDRFGMHFTKFPGEGLELGEGLVEGLIREWKEELDTTIKVMGHIYTTDFFQPSAFNPSDQIISVYYSVQLNTPLQHSISTKPFDFPEDQNERLCFRWVMMDDALLNQLTFPIDKLVVQKFLLKR